MLIPSALGMAKAAAQGAQQLRAELPVGPSCASRRQPRQRVLLVVCRDLFLDNDLVICWTAHAPSVLVRLCSLRHLAP